MRSPNVGTPTLNRKVLMTRYAILSDIHANINALEAVLKHISQLTPAVDEIWCLGDLVVYGPEPVRTIQFLEAEGILNREHPEQSRCVQGNNDFAVAHLLKAETTIAQLLSNPKIESPVKDDTVRQRRGTIMVIHDWTKRRLMDPELGDPKALEILKNLPQEAHLPGLDVSLFHASPCEPSGMHGNYLRDESDAEEAFLCQRTSLAFFGHTHLPTVFQQTSTELPFDNVKRITPKSGDRVELNLADGKKALVNPGSVGQPRDRIPQASYVVYDTASTVEFFRVEYPIDKVEQSIFQVGNELKQLSPKNLKGDNILNDAESSQIPKYLADRFRNADW